MQEYNYLVLFVCIHHHSNPYDKRLIFDLFILADHDLTYKFIKYTFEINPVS